MMMASSRLSPQLRNLWKLETRFIHSSGVTYKKKYDYDLDSLITWMKDTKLVFGSPRKPTKTGKLRKTKRNLGSQNEEYLETLSALSTIQTHSVDSFDIPSRSTNTKKKRNKGAVDFDIPDEVLSPHLPPPEAVPVYGRTTQFLSIDYTEPSSSSIDISIPDEVMDPFVMPADAVPVFDSSADTDDKSEQDTCHPEYTEDRIHIPKISPVPALNSQSPNKRKKKSLSVRDVNDSYGARRRLKENSVEDTNAKVDDSDVGDKVCFSEISTVGNAKSSKSNDYKRKSFWGSSASGSEEEDNTRFATDSDKKTRTGTKKGDIFENGIVIPKIAPVPSSKSPSIPTDLSTSPSLSSQLPIEAPESFNIIPKIPLCPKEASGRHGNIDSDGLAAFRMDVEQMGLRVLPSVKTILNKTMSDLNRYFLNRWREGMINELGEEGFKQHQEANIKRGVNLHANIMEYLSGKPVCELQIMPDNEGHWSSLQTALAAVSDVGALEEEIYHSMLLYRGVFDCVARYKDLLCIIDWKTSKKPRPLLKNTYDDPIQVAAYVGALNASESYVHKYGQVNHGMIVVAYPDGSPAHVHVMNRTLCEQYWQDWTDRLYNFYQLTYTEKAATKKEGVATSVGVKKRIGNI